MHDPVVDSSDHLEGAVPHDALVEVDVLAAPAGDGLREAVQVLEVGLVQAHHAQPVVAPRAVRGGDDLRLVAVEAEDDGEVHALARDGIHATAVQEVVGEFHVDVTEEEKRVRGAVRVRYQGTRLEAGAAAEGLHENLEGEPEAIASLVVLQQLLDRRTIGLVAGSLLGEVDDDKVDGGALGGQHAAKALHKASEHCRTAGQGKNDVDKLALCAVAAGVDLLHEGLHDRPQEVNAPVLRVDAVVPLELEVQQVLDTSQLIHSHIPVHPLVQVRRLAKLLQALLHNLLELDAAVSNMTHHLPMPPPTVDAHMRSVRHDWAVGQEEKAGTDSKKKNLRKK
eukprot:m.106287 g.106287  ORF g.106287 m.106287 type:complete len:338 (-) comp8942_c0_seq3:381-1394(-)